MRRMPDSSGLPMLSSTVSNSRVTIAENLTKEQYSGSYLPKLSIFSVTRDALNPRMNTEILRKRLWTIDHYRYRYGAKHTYWVHFALQKYGKKLWTYKLNYGLKALLFYNAYSQYQRYNKADAENYLSETERTVAHRLPILFSTGAFAGACLLI